MTSITRRGFIQTIGAQAIVLPAWASAAGWGAPPVPDDLPAGTADARGWATSASARHPDKAARREAFARRKVLTAYTDPASPKAERTAAAQRTAQRLGVAFQDIIDAPVPGGVGFGFFFTDAFRTAWGTGTSIRYDIVYPARPGGNVSDYLYLTTTNRSTLGTEALVAFYGQDEPWLFVWDWAVPGFVIMLPLSYLDAYVQAGNGAAAPQTLSIWNSTYNIGGFYYRNAVHLFNRQRGAWDLIWQNDYPSDDATQKAGGGWGPIVETFQPAYMDTRPMGFRRTAFSQADPFGRWSQWNLLKPDQSAVRADNNGFEVRNLNPNFGFMAVS